METLPAATLNHEIPPTDSLSLELFAGVLGYNNVEDLDYEGKNIFHHLFTAAKYCIIASRIALTCFDQNIAKMKGCYKTAMSQTVTGNNPFGWTPLHILLHNSDILMVQRDIVERLLVTIGFDL